MYAIGCDVGSQSLKGILLDPAGRIAAEASSSYDVDYPYEAWAEQDSTRWRSALADVIQRLLRDSGVRSTDVATLGLASQVDGVVPVDADGEPLAPAIVWSDRRATSQTRDLRERLDPDEVRQITGLNLDASHVLPKILWLRDERPDLHERAAGLLLPGSALVAWLTGERVLDHANASSTLLYDIGSGDWATRMLEACDIDPGRLGRIEPASTVVGRLRAPAAEAIGLTARTTVVTGTGDEHGAALGAGAIRPGVVVDIAGTAEPVCVAATAATIDPTGLLETHGHADPRFWLIENPGFVSGGSVTWFRGAIGGGAAPATLDAEAEAEARPGSDGVTFLPTLSGATAPRWNDRARGVYAGLSLNHGRPHLFRALLEGCTFALRDIVERMSTLDLAGDEIRVVGGGARSPFWLQMKADVTGRSIRVLAVSEATALGAVMLAGVASGTFRDLDEAVDRLTVLETRAYEPDPDRRAAYDEAYDRYRQLYDAVEPGFGASTGSVGMVPA